MSAKAVMQVDSLETLRAEVRRWRSAGERIALVPTMGNLHDGHLRLVEQATRLCDRVVVSIFVNPTQFCEGEDFESYPRTLEADAIKLLRQGGADLLFTPSAAAVYPSGNRTIVEVRELSDILCGAFRPGHFSGVATIVCKLFNMVQPDDAFFGEKDFQQLAVIRCMTADLNLPVRVHGVETLREADGLAMSSRNGYLTDEERRQAPQLFRILCSGRDAILAGDRDYAGIEVHSLAALTAAGFRPDYFSVRSQGDLLPATSTDTELVLLAAAWLGKARLIDNLKLDLKEG